MAKNYAQLSKKSVKLFNGDGPVMGDLKLIWTKILENEPNSWFKNAFSRDEDKFFEMQSSVGNYVVR